MYPVVINVYGMMSVFTYFYCWCILKWLVCGMYLVFFFRKSAHSMGEYLFIHRALTTFKLERELGKTSGRS